MQRSPYEPPKTTVKDQSDVAPPRPRPITLAIRLLWGGFVAGLVALHPWFRGRWWLNPDGSTPETGALAFGIALAVIFLGAGIVLFVLIGKRHSWARWALLVYLSIGWILQAIDLEQTISKTPLAAVIDLAIFLSELWVCYLLFLSPGARWFKRQDG